MLTVVDDAQVRADGGNAAWSESFSEMFAQVAGVLRNAAVRRHGRVICPELSGQLIYG